VFVEVKAKATVRFGDPTEMVGPAKLRRLRRAASVWLAGHPEHGDLEVALDVVAVRRCRIERVGNTA
jgi:Holliday junction resolvase-like predicted endonuclease